MSNEPTLTPYELEILLHVYYSPNFLPPNDEAWRMARNRLFQRELLKDKPCSTYRITERGRAYIEHLLRQPLPVCKWVCE